MTKFLGTLRPPALSSSPTSPSVGEIYFNTVSHTLFFWDGTVWVDTEGGDLNFTYSQGSPSTTWPINHGLGKVPSVTVYTSANDEVEPASVDVIDLNNLTLHFTAAFGGYAYLN